MGTNQQKKRNCCLTGIILLLMAAIFLLYCYCLIKPVAGGESIAGYHLTYATFVITFLGIIFVVVTFITAVSRYVEKKDIEKLKNDIDNKIKNFEKVFDEKIPILEKKSDRIIETINRSKQIMSALLKDYVERYVDIPKERTPKKDAERHYLALAITNLLKILVKDAIASDINRFFYLLERTPNEYIYSQLDDIERILLERCEDDKSFREDAIHVLQPRETDGRDYTNPFKLQIDRLRKNMRFRLDSVNT